jgi:prepilin-type N-terminal cleavage/methylation domain-containing protein/prepilin-type processing-associated H-X9-DG protein
MRRSSFHRALRAMTLVELLVAMAIVGVLFSLLLAAVHGSREAAQKASCANNLHQIGVAINQFHDGHTYFPPGGTFAWAKFDNYCANGKPNPPLKQGLGWQFHLLPYLEHANIVAAAAAAAVPGTIQGQLVLEQSPVPLYNCPARRGPTQWIGAENNNERPWLTDYAAPVAGPSRSEDPKGFPFYLADPLAHRQLLFWGCSTCGSTLPSMSDKAIYRGIIQRTDWDVSGTHRGFTKTISAAQITDGTSRTLLVSEKRLRPSKYLTGWWHDDRGGMDGWDPDTMRSTMFPIGLDGEDRDEDEDTSLPYSFGSAHPNSMNALFADGSVRPIAYDIDPETINRLGHRHDGEVIDEAVFK